jgi:hypothetical protein
LAKPNDILIASDIYGSRLRLNPVEDERSYATRLFRVRLDETWTTGDIVESDGDPWWIDGGPQAEIDKFKRAIWAAVGTNPGGHPEVPNLSVQDVSARQVGPYDFEVEASYYQAEFGGLTGADQSMTVTYRRASSPVYRSAYNNAGDTVFDATTGLPNGNFRGLGDGVLPAFGTNFEQWRYEFPVSEALVNINAVLNVIQYQTLFGPSGAMTLVGFHNDAGFTFESTTFGVGTLRFLGVSSTVRASGTDREYLVSYSFLWRPRGWWEQVLVPSISSPGFMNTQFASLAFPQASYAGKFPTS